MNETIKKQWIEALRSGNYTQGTGALHKRSSDGLDTFCCLGVLCVLAVDAAAIRAPVGVVVDRMLYGDDEHGGYLPKAVREWAGIGSEDGSLRNGDNLATHNDNGATFMEIADIIEQQELI